MLPIHQHNPLFAGGGAVEQQLQGRSLSERDNYSIAQATVGHWNIASSARPLSAPMWLIDRIHSLRASDWPIRWGWRVRGLGR